MLSKIARDEFPLASFRGEFFDAMSNPALMVWAVSGGGDASAVALCCQQTLYKPREAAAGLSRCVLTMLGTFFKLRCLAEFSRGSVARAWSRPASSAETR
jgi:hypothetical protein